MKTKEKILTAIAKQTSFVNNKMKFYSSLSDKYIQKGHRELVPMMSCSLLNESIKIGKETEKLVLDSIKIAETNQEFLTVDIDYLLGIKKKLENIIKSLITTKQNFDLYLN